MHYLLLMHYQESPSHVSPEQLAEGMRAMDSYAGALEQAGVLLAAEVLQPSTSSTTVRLVGEELQVQDGPFADTKEQLGGVFVLDLPDLDAALTWARRAPAVGWGAVEVRPVATYTRDGKWQENR